MICFKLEGKNQNLLDITNVICLYSFSTPAYIMCLLLKHMEDFSVLNLKKIYIIHPVNDNGM